MTYKQLQREIGEARHHTRADMIGSPEILRKLSNRWPSLVALCLERIAVERLKYLHLAEPAALSQMYQDRTVDRIVNEEIENILAEFRREEIQ